MKSFWVACKGLRCELPISSLHGCDNLQVQDLWSGLTKLLSAAWQQKKDFCFSQAIDHCRIDTCIQARHS